MKRGQTKKKGAYSELSLQATVLLGAGKGVAVTLGIGIGRAVSLGVRGSRVEVMGFMRTPRSWR